YAYDDKEIQLVDLANGEQLPEQVIKDITGDKIIKAAYNAQFERVCLSKHLNLQLSLVSWYCTAVQSAMLGLPLSLEGVGQVLGLQHKKMREGKSLIRYFSVPCKPTKTNGHRTRNLPQHAPDKWQTFKDYCIRDVDVERAIRLKLEKYPISAKEKTLYILDQQINDRGVRVDTELVSQAIFCDELYKSHIYVEAQELTGLGNPNSVPQLKEWLLQNGVGVESLSKKAVADLARESNGEIEHLLNLRLQLAKTSVRKYKAIERSVCPDGRVRGLLQFYGANRTGRWAGRLVQVHNLPQNHIPDLTLARNLIKAGCFDELEMLYELIPNLLSELIRTAFIPKENHRFIVADFSAIEARVIAWLAGEKWRMDVFATHGKIYEASASQMFKVPIKEITKGSPLRQKGKIAELALGYGGSVGALTAMGALEMGVAPEELQPLVNAWRAANPNITRLWWEIDHAAITAVKEKTIQKVGRITIQVKSGILFITLPSGRSLSYIKPRIETNKFGREGITYEGIGENKRWCRIDTYGPKLVENIVQATARDLLAEAMLAVDRAGYEIVMHVHDEIVVEAPTGTGSQEEVCQIMNETPSWAEGLPLRADGYECEYYRKD
ncbi:MAG: DNA polymerase, partial [Deltaproteobacteria bacterium]